MNVVGLADTLMNPGFNMSNLAQFSVRWRMVVFAVLAALVCFVLIGVTVYEGAFDSKVRQEIQMLEKLLRQFDEKHFSQKGKNDLLQGKIVMKRLPVLLDLKSLEVELFSNIFLHWESMYQGDAGGYIYHRGNYYTWSTIKRDHYYLAAVHRVQGNNIEEFFRSTGSGLIGSGIFILYLLIWTALIVASLFKKLDIQKAKLEVQANHDALTGLPNRVSLKRYLAQLLEQSRQNESTFAIILMDLDRFKEINDKKGHDAGDAVLKDVSNIIRACIRESDFAARIGGDEFMLIFPKTSLEDLREIASRIMESISPEQNTIGVSLGAAFFPKHGMDSEEIIRRADEAMYVAKRSGLGFNVYEHKRSFAISNRLH